MSWGYDFTVKRLALQGGDQCPSCKNNSLCLNGLKAKSGHKIVVCSNCANAFCARCGKAVILKDEAYSCLTCPGQ